MEHSTEFHVNGQNISFVDLKDGDMLEIFQDANCVLKLCKDGKVIKLVDYSYKHG